MTAWRSALSIAGVVLSVGAPAYGHGGGLNAQGCHHNRKTGDYHCHRAPPAPSTSMGEGRLPARAPAEGVVKKSQSGICHAPGTTYYGRTLHFEPFDSLEACLASGGRKPKR